MPNERLPARRRGARGKLTRDLVLRTAVHLADDDGLDAVSMRKLGQALRVEAMSLYKHVANKDDVLDGMADLVTGEFALPSPDLDWKDTIRQSAISAHEVLRRHPWAGALIESRSTAGPARLRYLEAVLGTLAAAGFPLPVVVRAIMALDSHTYGFVLQEQAWPFEPEDAPAAASAFAGALPAAAYPNLRAVAELAQAAPDDVRADFAFGLDLLLDSLERLLASTGR